MDESVIYLIAYMLGGLSALGSFIPAAGWVPIVPAAIGALLSIGLLVSELRSRSKILVPLVCLLLNLFAIGSTLLSIFRHSWASGEPF